MDIERYLNRIGASEQRRPPSLRYLAQLQRQHLYHVPFENLSVIRGEPIVLDERLLVAKVVDHGRGGFCYELNGAFCWLLRELGYDVTRVAAGVYNAGPAAFGPTFDHMTLLARIDGVRYLVDVGFGDSARTPIPLPNGHVEDVSGRYRLLLVDRVVSDVATETHILEKIDENGAWRPQYRFTDTPRELTDYSERCAFLSTSPASHFTQHIICTIARPDGRVSVSADSLTITHNGSRQKTPLVDSDAVNSTLERYFGPQYSAF